jgi:hypothetical protein
MSGASPGHKISSAILGGIKRPVRTTNERFQVIVGFVFGHADRHGNSPEIFPGRAFAQFLARDRRANILRNQSRTIEIRIRKDRKSVV